MTFRGDSLARLTRTPKRYEFVLAGKKRVPYEVMVYIKFGAVHAASRWDFGCEQRHAAIL